MGRFFLSFLIFQSVTVFVSISEWTQIKVVVNDCDSKKTVRGLAHVAEIPCAARGLGSGGHIRKWQSH